MTGTERTLPKQPVSAEMAAYNEAWRVMTALHKSMFQPATVGTDPQYLENRLRLAFEHGWNSCANWFEARTIKEISSGQ